MLMFSKIQTMLLLDINIELIKKVQLSKIIKSLGSK